MMTVYLTTYLPADAIRDKPVRRRRLLGRGRTVRCALREGFLSDPELSTHVVLIDGAPVAYAIETQWTEVNGTHWGTGFEIGEES